MPAVRGKHLVGHLGAKRSRLLRHGRSDNPHEAENVHAHVQQGPTHRSRAWMAGALDVTLDSTRPARQDHALHTLDRGGGPRQVDPCTTAQPGRQQPGDENPAPHPHPRPDVPPDIQPRRRRANAGSVLPTPLELWRTTPAVPVASLLVSVQRNRCSAVWTAQAEDARTAKWTSPRRAKPFALKPANRVLGLTGRGGRHAARCRAALGQPHAGGAAAHPRRPTQRLSTPPSGRLMPRGRSHLRARRRPGLPVRLDRTRPHGSCRQVWPGSGRAGAGPCGDC
jgi:hypothetical protein